MNFQVFNDDLISLEQPGSNLYGKFIPLAFIKRESSMT